MPAKIRLIFHTTNKKQPILRKNRPFSPKSDILLFFIYILTGFVRSARPFLGDGQAGLALPLLCALGAEPHSRQGRPAVAWAEAHSRQGRPRRQGTEAHLREGRPHSAGMPLQSFVHKNVVFGSLNVHKNVVFGSLNVHKNVNHLSITFIINTFALGTKTQVK